MAHVASPFDPTLLLRCGDVERNPGPTLRGFQWNVQGLSTSKDLALKKLLESDEFHWCVLFETHFTPSQSVGYSIAGFQHCGLGRNANGGGVSILVRAPGGLRMETGKKVMLPGFELVTATILLPDSATLTIVAAYFTNGKQVTPHTLACVSAEIPDGTPVVVVMDCNCHDNLWDNTKKPDVYGTRLASWSAGLELECANTGEPTWRRTVTSVPPSAPDVTFSRDCAVEGWTPTFCTDSDHAYITMDVQVGGTVDRPFVFKQSTRLYSWKKANWRDFRHYTRDQFRSLKAHLDTERAGCKQSAELLPTGQKERHPQRSTKGAAPQQAASSPAETKSDPKPRLTVNEIAIRVTRIISKGVKRSVPCAVAKRAPLWTPELEKLDEEIKNHRGDPVRLDTLAKERTRKLREAVALNWRKALLHTDGSVKANTYLLRDVFTPRSAELPIHEVGEASLSSTQYANKLAAIFSKKVGQLPKRAPHVVLPPIPKKQFLVFSIGELEQALREMHLGSAPGIDGIHAEPLRSLPPVGQRTLLRLYNRSIMRCQVPAAWRTSLVIPIAEKGQTPQVLDSFRPVHLTSNLCKVLERMVAHRMRAAVEPHMCPQQTLHRSDTADIDPVAHLMSLTHMRLPKEKVGVVVIPYGRAFDTVLHCYVVDALICHKVDPWLIRWTADFLQNRVVQVKVHDALSDKVMFLRGLPQGSVLAPLLFSIMMNGLSERLNAIPGVEHAMGKKEFAILVRGSSNAQIQSTLQAAVDCVASWTHSQYMELNVADSRFSLFGAQVLGLMTLRMNGAVIKEERNPTVFGVTLNAMSGAAAHVDALLRRDRYRLVQLTGLTAGPSGLSCSATLPLYFGLVQSQLLLGCEAWWYAASHTSRHKLEQFHNHAAGIISGVPMGGSRADVLNEAHMYPLDAVVMARCVKYYLTCKARGGARQKHVETLFGPKHPVHSTMSAVSAHCQDVDDFDVPLSPLCLRKAAQPFFNISPPGGLSAAASVEEKLRATLTRVAAKASAKYKLWTDGSSKWEVGAGSAAMLESDGSVSFTQTPAGRLASGYRAECLAMEAGLSHLLALVPRASRRCVAAVFTDSQKLLVALSAGPTKVTEGVYRRIWRLIFSLREKRVHLSFQLVFSHVGLREHDKVDAMAKQACSFPQYTPAWVPDIVAAVRRLKIIPQLQAVSERPTQRQLLTGSSLFTPSLTSLTRQEEVLAAQFRCGASRKFGWLHRLLNRDLDMSCRWCRGIAAEEEIEQPPQALQRLETDSKAAPPAGQLAPSKIAQRVIVAPRARDPVFCPICYEWWQDRPALRRHLESRLHKKSSARSLKMSIESLKAPPRGKRIECPHCQYSTASCERFRSHMLGEHAGEKLPPPSTVQDVLMPAAEKKVMDLPVLKAFDPTRKRYLFFKCKHCQRRFHQEHSFKSHMLKCIPPPLPGEPPRVLTQVEESGLWQCPYCILSTYLEFYPKHFWAYHRDYPIPVFPPRVSEEGRPVALFKGEELFECPYCKENIYKLWLPIHVNQKHKGKAVPLFADANGKKVRRSAKSRLSPTDSTKADPGFAICDLCKLPIAISHMRNHLKKVHKQKNPPKPTLPPRWRPRKYKDDEGYQCLRCKGTVYLSMEAFRNHHRASHPPSKNGKKVEMRIQVYKLVDPEEDAEQVTALPEGAPATYSRTHPEKGASAKPFRCQVCGHTTNTDSGMRAHVNDRHAGHSSFIEVIDGEERIRKMTRKTIVCSLCNKGLSGPASLSIHLATMHQIGELVSKAPWIRDHRCEETPEHILECPGLKQMRHRHGIKAYNPSKTVFTVAIVRFLHELFSSPVEVPHAPEAAASASRKRKK